MSEPIGSRESREQKVTQRFKAKKGGVNYVAGEDLTVHQYGTDIIRSSSISHTLIDQSTRGYTPPAEYSNAWTILTGHGVVVLRGSEGTGRWTTAVNLLAARNKELDGELQLRQLKPDWDVPDIYELPVRSNHGFLLDLTDAGDKSPPAMFGARLLDYAEALSEQESSLIVIVSERDWRDCSAYTHEITVNIEPPLATSVAKRKLHNWHSAERASWVDSAPIKDLLTATSSPSEAIRLAQVITRSHDSEQGKQDAVDEFLGWKDYLAKWFKDKEPRTRAMMIAAATLGDCTASDIIDLSTRMLEITGNDDVAYGPLGGPDLNERMEEIDAQHTQHGISITAQRPGLDFAVLDYIWEQRPQFQQYFLHWIVDIAQKRSGKLRTERIPDMLSNMAVKQAPSVFLERVEIWAGSGRPQREIARGILERTVLDARVGARVRGRMLEILKLRDPGPNLVQVIADVCGGQLGREKTSVALTRLYYILSRRDIGSDVGTVPLVNIAKQPELRLPVLEAVLGWLERKETRPGGVAAFLGVMNVSNGVAYELIEHGQDSGSVMEKLATGWEIVGRAADKYGPVNETIREWLDAAASETLSPDKVVTILTPAFRQHAKALFNTVITPLSDVGKGTDTVRKRLVNNVLEELIPGPSEDKVGGFGEPQ